MLQYTPDGHKITLDIFLWSNLTHSAGISTRPCWGLKPNFSSHLDISRFLRTRSKLLHIIFNWHQLEMFPPKSPPWNGCQNVVWLIHWLQACPVLGETMLTKPPFDIFSSLLWKLILNWQALQLSAWPKTWQTSFVNRIHGQDGSRCLRPLLEPLFTSERWGKPLDCHHL